MARLSHREQAFQKKLMYVGAGLVLLVIFLLVFGLNSLINISAWFGNMVSGNKNQTVEKNENFFGTLYVDNLPPATNSAELIVSGNSSNYDTLIFKINGKKVQETKVIDDTFSEKIGPLKEGENTLVVIAQSKKSKEAKESDPYSIIYKKTKPKLEISEPKDGDTIKSQTPEVTIKGSTDPGNTVEIAGAPVTVGVSGAFQSSIRLKDGDNTILIIAQDDATNQQQIELKLKYQKDE